MAVRARPLSSSEHSQGCRECLRLESTLGLVDAGGDRKFDFDYVYGPNTAQSVIYDQTTAPLLNHIFEGYNATIIAYGQVILKIKLKIIFFKLYFLIRLELARLSQWALLSVGTEARKMTLPESSLAPWMSSFNGDLA